MSKQYEFGTSIVLTLDDDLSDKAIDLLAYLGLEMPRPYRFSAADIPANHPEIESSLVELFNAGYLKEI